MSEWDGIASRINKMWRDNQGLKNIMRKVNLNGLIEIIDKKGRVLIRKDLRRKTNLKGRISIAGEKGYLILKRID